MKTEETTGSSIKLWALQAELKRSNFTTLWTFGRHFGQTQNHRWIRWLNDWLVRFDHTFLQWCPQRPKNFEKLCFFGGSFLPPQLKSLKSWPAILTWSDLGSQIQQTLGVPSCNLSKNLVPRFRSLKSSNNLAESFQCDPNFGVSFDAPKQQWELEIKFGCYDTTWGTSFEAITVLMPSSSAWASQIHLNTRPNKMRFVERASLSALLDLGLNLFHCEVCKIKVQKICGTSQVMKWNLKSPTLAHISHLILSFYFF